MDPTSKLVMAIGVVVLTVAVAGLVGLLVARHLDNKRGADSAESNTKEKE